MGTHPIFESDFDCLTVSRVWKEMAFLARGLRLPVARSVRQLTFSAPLASAVKPVTRDDLIADPKVFQSMLYCCRRLNNFPAAMRTLECMRLKCGPREDVYDWLCQELAPTLEDLGLPSVEDMN